VQNILVAFQTAHQSIESLALAAALGAVQGGANIRLRHLDPSPAAELTHAAYGVLREADLLWADALIVGVESDATTSELNQFADIVRELGKQGKLAGKPGWAFGPAGTSACEALAHLHSAMSDADMVLLEAESVAPTPESIGKIGHSMAQK
jgi:hypothetical protein